MSFSVTIKNNKIIATGRPAFSAKTNKKIKVITGIQDRRHILHGATQITKVLVDSFNRILEKQQEPGLLKVLGSIRKNLKIKKYKLVPESSPIEKKIEDLITIAFGKEENLVAGFAVENQGIEKGRQAIGKLKEDLAKYISKKTQNLMEIKKFALNQVEKNLSSEIEKGKVTAYKEWILQILKESIENAESEFGIMTILDDFEFSCTLDILHEGTSKEQNSQGLSAANRLHKAIAEHNEEEIFAVLF